MKPIKMKKFANLVAEMKYEILGTWLFFLLLSLAGNSPYSYAILFLISTGFTIGCWLFLFGLAYLMLLFKKMEDNGKDSVS